MGRKLRSATDFRGRTQANLPLHDTSFVAVTVLAKFCWHSSVFLSCFILKNLVKRIKYGRSDQKLGSIYPCMYPNFCEPFMMEFSARQKSWIRASSSSSISLAHFTDSTGSPVQNSSLYSVSCPNRYYSGDVFFVRTIFRLNSSDHISARLITVSWLRTDIQKHFLSIRLICLRFYVRDGLFVLSISMKMTTVSLI